MALPVREQAKYWGIVAVGFLAVLWFLGDVVLPFVIGGAIAYILDPIADWFERHGFTRVSSVSIISLAALFVFIILVLLVIPMMIDQSTALITNAPTLFRSLQGVLNDQFPDLMTEGSRLNKSLVTLGETIQSKGGALLNGVINSFSSLVNVLLLVFFVPVVAFYLLLDWDNMVAKIDDLLPRDHAPLIRHLASQIDATMSAFIRGQGTVCLVLGAFYALALMMVGLQFGLFVGFLAGLISFIPFVGAIFGGTLALGLALFQFWGEWPWIGAVAGIFLFGQMIEGNVLTPRLVGKSVGLHPVWLIFALSAFGTIFGFVGMLVAVPIAASIGVLTRFGTEQYKCGRLYRGLEGLSDQTKDDTR